MKGKILLLETGSSEGLISGDDGQRYKFSASEIRRGPLQEGRVVDFLPSGDAASEIFAVGASALGQRDWVSFYLSPKGRVSRRDYWLFGFLGTLVTSVLLGWIPLLGQIVLIVCLWSSIALAFKRFHDRGFSGFWVFVPGALTTLGWMELWRSFFSANGASHSTGFTLVGAGFAAYLTILLLVFLQAGESGANKYGPDPRG